MATITFPTQVSGDVTVDVDEIVDLQPAGALTIVTVADGHFYQSPAPYEMFEITLAQGGGVVPFQSGPQLGATFEPPPVEPPDEGD